MHVPERHSVRHLGLRAKSLLALLLVALVGTLLAALVGWATLDRAREAFGQSHARNLSELNRQRILAPVSRELALALRFADAQATRRFLASPDDPVLAAAFAEEAEGFREAFRDNALFAIDAASGRYWFADDADPQLAEPRYRLSRDDADDSWFYASMKTTDRYNINVNVDSKLQTTKVWFNVIVADDAHRLGLAGSGLDLGAFLSEFVASGEPGVTPIIVDRHGAIQAHPDPTRIAFDSSTGATAARHTLFRSVPDDQQPRLQQMLAAAEADPERIVDGPLTLDGRRQHVAIGYLPELGWHVLTSVDLGLAQLIEPGWLWLFALLFVALLGAVLVGFGLVVERLLLRRLERLQLAAGKVAGGNYAIDLADDSGDEIAALSAAFAGMAAQVGRHTAELEQRVRERTAALEQANREMIAAHRKIDDSIDYASLLQRAMLPSRQLQFALGNDQYVLWRPRDTVGGDFFVFLPAPDGFLIGVVDCAGHGVPGALMTMLVHAAVGRAVAELGPDAPAALLERVDATMRSSMQAAELPRALAANVDFGLARVDYRAGELRFAGARIGLLWSDGEQVDEVAGDRRALNDRRPGQYRAHRLPLVAGRCWCMVTDGLLDQAGGDRGFGFGGSRLRGLLAGQAGLSLDQRAERIADALAGWQGTREQRDDITLLLFRADPVDGAIESGTIAAD